MFFPLLRQAIRLAAGKHAHPLSPLGAWLCLFSLCLFLAFRLFFPLFFYSHHQEFSDINSETASKASTRIPPTSQTATFNHSVIRCSHLAASQEGSCCLCKGPSGQSNQSVHTPAKHGHIAEKRRGHLI